MKNVFRKFPEFQDTNIILNVILNETYNMAQPVGLKDIYFRC